eukprot:353460-Chlamydomonas_euryale.AAC.11
MPAPGRGSQALRDTTSAQRFQRQQQAAESELSAGATPGAERATAARLGIRDHASVDRAIPDAWNVPAAPATAPPPHTVPGAAPEPYLAGPARHHHRQIGGTVDLKRSQPPRRPRGERNHAATRDSGFPRARELYSEGREYN